MSGEPCSICGARLSGSQRLKDVCDNCGPRGATASLSGVKVVGKTAFKVITLCGSTRFKKEFMDIQKELTLKGNIVISVGCFGHNDPDERITQNKEMLDGMHLAKIDMADGVVVVSPGGYYGKSTKREIEYATKHKKTVEYYSPPIICDNCGTEMKLSSDIIDGQPSLLCPHCNTYLLLGQDRKRRSTQQPTSTLQSTDTKANNDSDSNKGA